MENMDIFDRIDAVTKKAHDLMVENQMLEYKIIDKRVELEAMTKKYEQALVQMYIALSFGFISLGIVIWAL